VPIHPIPSALSRLLDRFRDGFTRPGFENFVSLVTGWLLVPGRHTISRAIQAAHGPGGGKHHATLYRFLARGRWQADELGRTLLRLLLVWLPDEITVLVDDTLCHKSGPHLFGAGMHHDASRSTYGRGRKRIKGFAFGHQWVVLAVRLACPWDAGRGWAVPIAFRLYRPARRCARAEYRKRTDLAAELVTLVASWLPADRRLRVVGDAEYACRTLVRALPPHSRLVGPLPMDAALFKRPGRPHRPGRPRRKGQRLPNPARLVASKRRGWQRVSLRLYGHPVTLRIWTRVCLWYHVAGSTPVRVVVTQDPKGRARPRAYLCTDPDCPAHEVLESYAQRWELEVALRNAKQSLGVEDPQNGWWRRKHGRRSDSRAPGPRPRGRRGEQAVRHTVPLAFVAYALVLVWYLGQGDPQREVRRTRRIAPWYRHKQHPSYADMLAALRQALWRERLSPNPPGQSDPQKLVELLPLWLLAA
jgi:hypothetical protein